MTTCAQNWPAIFPTGTHRHSAGGQTLWVRLPHGDATSFAQAALRDHVAVLPGNGLDASGRSGEYLRLHFLASPGDLTEATRRLAKAWHTYHPQVRVTSPAALTV